MFTKNFTCVHGINHEAAVFEVVGVNIFGNANKSLTVDALGAVSESENSNFNVDFSAHFWVSKEAKDNGKLPMQFTLLDSDNISEQSIFALDGLDKPFEMDKTDLILAAEERMKSLMTQDQ